MSEVKERLRRMKTDDPHRQQHGAVGALARTSTASESETAHGEATRSMARGEFGHRSQRFAASVERLAQSAARKADTNTAVLAQGEELRPADDGDTRRVWNDARRPAGSEFSEDDWRRAEESVNEKALVFEIHKPLEYALIVVPLDRLDFLHRQVLDRSLVIAEPMLALFAHRDKVAMHIEQRHPDMGMFRYGVVLSAERAQRLQHLRGAVLRNWESGSDVGANASRADRFGTRPR